MARKALVEKCKKEPRFQVRKYNRCQSCGRQRSVYRKFQLCRMCLRKHAQQGQIPGMTMASW